MRALAPLLLAACSHAADPCAGLPACATPEPSMAAYGSPCTTDLADGWAGGDGGPNEPTCCLDGQRFASCVPAGLGGEPCDPDAPASCTYPLRCAGGVCAP